MPEAIILTSAGAEKLKHELNFLKKEKRMQLAERIQAAKEYGDLSENAEYHEAKEEQAFVEGRMAEIEQILKVATVVDKKDSLEIGVGSTVTVSSEGQESTYLI